MRERTVPTLALIHRVLIVLACYTWLGAVEATETAGDRPPKATAEVLALVVETMAPDAAGARALREARCKRTDLEMRAFHPQGTCRMGERPADAVVDSYGRHHGIRNLLVADASSFPSSCKVLWQLTIMALATRIANRLAADLNACTWDIAIPS
jgi:choline dehydrogenase-like flavoprotein